MKTLKLIILNSILFFGSCAGWKELMVINGNNEDAIKNAINDYLNSSSLRKHNSVFSVRLLNFKEEILGISIYGASEKLHVVKDGDTFKYSGLPSNFIERGGKLFYWYDSTKTISPELINVLKKFNHIDTIILNETMPGTFIDEYKKAQDYFFCKNNLCNYKKVRTNFVMGYYKPPKLDCQCSKVP